jgi:uncharacterized protein
MRFACDAMLGKLARYLRILGLDAPCPVRPGDMKNLGPEAHPCCFFTRRTVARAGVNVVFIRSDRPREQVKEILSVIGPYIDPSRAMTRCISCNVSLADIGRADAERHVPEFVYHRYETFRMCPSCGKVYWEGSHTAHMSSFVKEIFGGHGME